MNGPSFRHDDEARLTSSPATRLQPGSPELEACCKTLQHYIDIGGVEERPPPGHEVAPLGAQDDGLSDHAALQGLLAGDGAVHNRADVDEVLLILLDAFSQVKFIITNVPAAFNDCKSAITDHFKIFVPITILLQARVSRKGSLMHPDPVDH